MAGNNKHTHKYKINEVAGWDFAPTMGRIAAEPNDKMRVSVEMAK